MKKNLLLTFAAIFGLLSIAVPLATDVTPSRLQRAKLAISDFMRRHAHSRLGLVAFAGQAFLQCPLTFDYSAFEETLMIIDEKTIPVPGTDVGLALEEGYRALEKGERHKLLVLITDGEDLEKGGVREAERLAKEGVVIFTIGVGTPAGSEVDEGCHHRRHPAALLRTASTVIDSAQSTR